MINFFINCNHCNRSLQNFLLTNFYNAIKKSRLQWHISAHHALYVHRILVSPVLHHATTHQHTRVRSAFQFTCPHRDTEQQRQATYCTELHLLEIKYTWTLVVSNMHFAKSLSLINMIVYVPIIRGNMLSYIYIYILINYEPCNKEEYQYFNFGILCMQQQMK